MMHIFTELNGRQSPLTPFDDTIQLSMTASRINLTYCSDAKVPTRQRNKNLQLQGNKTLPTLPAQLLHRCKVPQLPSEVVTGQVNQLDVQLTDDCSC